MEPLQIEQQIIDRCKLVSCTYYLQMIGYVKENKGSGKYSFFKSPFRDEKTASFSINEHRNSWCDFGTGRSGDCITLVQLIEGVDFPTAIKKLSVLGYIPLPQKKDNTEPIEILEVKPLKNNALISYLRDQRGINISLVIDFVKEVHFLNNGNKQYAIGFENDKGGFELRNKFIKIGTAPKAITTIPGKNNNASVFEGFIDWFSAVSYYGKHSDNTIIILNSVVFVNQVPKTVYDKIYYFGDNDKAGDDCFKQLHKAIDMRGIFEGFEDFNDFHRKMRFL